MGENNGSRSSKSGVLGQDRQADLFGQGVGGRQGQGHPPAGGGGSSDNCTNFEVALGAKKNRAADPRLGELREMGMHPRWIRIAEEIGIDAFLAVWRLLDENPPNMPGSTVYVSMPRFTRFLRYQRNRFIEAMVVAGAGSTDIKKRLKAELCEEVSVRHIDRISKKIRSR